MKIQIHKIQKTGFTLLELLLVMAVIAVLSTMAVGVMASAQEDSRVAATRSRVRIITSLLEQELEDYEVRRLPVGQQWLDSVWQTHFSRAPGFPARSANYDPRKRALYRRNLARRLRMDLIRNELPNNRAAVQTAAGALFPSQSFATNFRNRYSNLTTPEADASLRQLQRGISSKAVAWRNFPGDRPAEFLYAILSRIDYHGSTGLDAIGNQAIGDSDGDGVLEIVDGWGEPMEFVIQQKFLMERVDSGVPQEEWGENTAGTGFSDPNFPAVQFIDLGRSLPNTPIDTRVLVTSAKLREIDYPGHTNSAIGSNKLGSFAADFVPKKPADFEPSIDGAFEPIDGNRLDSDPDKETGKPLSGSTLQTTVSF